MMNEARYEKISGKLDITTGQKARAKLRVLFFDHGVIRSKVARDKEAEGIKYLSIP